MRRESCDKCGKPAQYLTAVQTARATHWSPGEWELVCDRCIEYEDDARRDAALEKRWEVRTGR